MDTITIKGLVATTPRYIVTSEGMAIMSLRLASNQRKFNHEKGAWVEADTNWYTVTAFHQLATNASNSINKGDRVIVTGNLRIRDWDSGDRQGTTVELEAEAIGHDLNWGTSSYQRVFAKTAEEEKAPTE